MRRFRNILALYADDPSHDDALIQAADLAFQNDAHLTLLKLGGKRGRRASSPAAQTVELSRKRGVKVTLVERSGRPSHDVMGQALSGMHDLVIMAGQPPRGLQKLRFGDTAVQTLRNCPCPVWVVQPGGNGTYSHILVALDATQPKPGLRTLHNKLLDMATSLAQMKQASLHVLYAWKVNAFDLDAEHANLTSSGRESLLARTQLDHEKQLDKILQPYGLSELPHSVHVMHGELEDLVPELSKRFAIDLLLAGSPGAPGISNAAADTTRSELLNRINYPFLSVRPDGFIPPVPVEGAELSGGRASTEERSPRMTESAS